MRFLRVDPNVYDLCVVDRNRGVEMTPTSHNDVRNPLDCETMTTMIPGGVYDHPQLPPCAPSGATRPVHLVDRNRHRAGDAGRRHSCREPCGAHLIGPGVFRRASAQLELRHSKHLVVRNDEPRQKQHAI